jgi:hypothetical protein
MQEDEDGSACRKTVGPMKNELKFVSPWTEPHSPDSLALELEREVATGHVLYEKLVKALAVARGRSDVLFEIEDAEKMVYAVVHLTWTQKQEPPPWPTTTIFNSLEQWIEWIKADHDDYMAGNEQ